MAIPIYVRKGEDVYERAQKSVSGLMATGPKRDTQYVEALLSKRIEYVKKLKTDLNTNSCATAQTIAAYSDLLEGDLSS